MGHVAQVTTTTFPAEVLESPLPVLVDFYTTWCPPCRMLAPILEQFAQDHAGKLKVVKIDAEAEEPVSVKYEVNAFPTLLLFKNGEVVEQHLGALPLHALRQWLTPHMAG